MQCTMNRRRFLCTTAGTLAAASVLTGTAWSGATENRAALSTPSAEKLGWKIAMSAYTFRSMPFYDALDQIEKLGVRHVETAFFLPLDKKRPGLQTNENLPSAVRKEMKKTMEDHGISMPNYYANVTADADANRKVFEYAKEMGTHTIVAEPPPEAFDGAEKLCNEFQINLAVHNHPKAPNYQNWNPDNVLALCKGRGKRIGACCDTGHWIRSGLHVVPMLKKLQGRILAVHLKDVAQWNTPDARDVPLGEGLADYEAVLRELHRQEYQGVMTVEYEHESDQLMQDVAQCLAFVEQTSAKLIGT